MPERNLPAIAQQEVISHNDKSVDPHVNENGDPIGSGKIKGKAKIPSPAMASKISLVRNVVLSLSKLLYW